MIKCNKMSKINFFIHFVDKVCKGISLIDDCFDVYMSFMWCNNLL